MKRKKKLSDFILRIVIVPLEDLSSLTVFSTNLYKSFPPFLFLFDFDFELGWFTKILFARCNIPRFLSIVYTYLNFWKRRGTKTIFKMTETVRSYSGQDHLNTKIIALLCRLYVGQTVQTNLVFLPGIWSPEVKVFSAAC